MKDLADMTTADLGALVAEKMTPADFDKLFGKRFVYLGKVNLERLGKWCLENEGDPLAEAFEGACAALGLLDRSKIIDQLAASRPRHNAIRIASQLEDLAYQYRDTMGRVILKMMKSEGEL